MRIVTPTAAALEDACSILRSGGLIAVPTETVYGLAGDATNPHAVAAIYAAKGRPRFNPLITHVVDVQAAGREGVLDDRALALAARFWPGPLTIVAPRSAASSVRELACAGLSSIALRAPAHEAMQRLLHAYERPLAAPSANPSGRISPTTAGHVAADAMADVQLIIDGGACMHGVESTIVALTPGSPARLLREGAVIRAEIEAIIGPLGAPEGAIAAPGMLESHYAPLAPLRLNATSAAEDEVFIAFSGPAPDNGFTLSERGDLREAAARLFAVLRAADARAPAGIAVACIPESGLGAAINDRLRRAAAPRA